MPDPRTDDEQGQPEETDEEYQARRDRAHNEALRRILEKTPEEWDKSRASYEEREREKTKKLFGDNPPTIYVDRYADL